MKLEISWGQCSTLSDWLIKAYQTKEGRDQAASILQLLPEGEKKEAYRKLWKQLKDKTKEEEK